MRIPVLILMPLAVMLGLSSCKPPPTDEVMDRSLPEEVPTGPSKPIDSPDSDGAIWSPSMIENRLIYGQPGQAPMLALSCEQSGDEPTMQITRYAQADEGAGAFLALVGNGHIARIPVDAVEHRSGFVWQGSIAASQPNVEVLTGPRQITATLPGAGMITLNPSTLPGVLIENCRRSVDAETHNSSQQDQAALQPSS